jgi:hypothetical protein
MSWAIGPRLQGNWAALVGCAQVNKRQSVGLERKFQPTAAGKYEKGFLFFKSFLNFEPI